MKTKELEPLIIKATERFAKQFRGIREKDPKTEKLNKILRKMTTSSDMRKVMTSLVQELTGLKVDPDQQLNRVKMPLYAAFLFIGNDISRDWLGKIALVRHTIDGGLEFTAKFINGLDFSDSSPNIDSVRPATEQEIQEYIKAIPVFSDDGLGDGE